MLDSSEVGGGQKINPRAHRAGLRRLSARANAERIPASSATGASSSYSSSTSSSSAAGAGAGPASAGATTVFFSFSRYGQELVDHLRACGVEVSPGLSEAEFERIEAVLGFSFPPDLRGVLGQGVPTGPGFPDWRLSSPSTLRRWMDLPLAGLCDEVAKGRFWCSRQWGPRPTTPAAAARAARVAMRQCPLLVPVFGHFFVPVSSPSRAGNPVFLARNGLVVCCGGGIGELLRKGFSAWSSSSEEFDEEEEEFPFVVVGESGEAAAAAEVEEGERRWSTSSMMSDLGGRGWIVDKGLEERSRSLPGRLSVPGRRGDYESWGRHLDALARSSEALVQLKNKSKLGPSLSSSSSTRTGEIEVALVEEDSDDQRKKNKENCSSSSGGAGSSSAACRNSERRPQLKRMVMHNLRQPAEESHAKATAVASGVRRIEFWSDVADKMLLNAENAEDLLSLSSCLSSTIQHHHHRRTASTSSSAASVATNSSMPAATTSAAECGDKCDDDDTNKSNNNNNNDVAASSSSDAAAECGHNDDDNNKDVAASSSSCDVVALTRSGGDCEKSNGGSSTKWVSSILDDVAARLRSAGWREDDISEMVDSSSPKSVLCPAIAAAAGAAGGDHHNDEEEEEGIFFSFDDSLSNSLKKAGFSVQEVTDALCFDFIAPPSSSKQQAASSIEQSNSDLERHILGIFPLPPRREFEPLMNLEFS